MSKDVLKKYDTILSGAMVFLIVMCTYLVLGYAPFGTKSLAYSDANIQYFDFYCYFKDVLAGRNNISYSFGKTLGGTNIAVFSYYLASPLNLLVVFFKKSQLHVFFDLLVAIKLSLATVTCSVFIRNYFNREYKILKKSIIIILSASYALSQYSIAQSSNIMWLDGVILLPLILLYVHEIMSGGEVRCLKLSVVVGISIIMNWYIAGINCLFSGFWVIYELIKMWCITKKGDRRKLFISFFRYLRSMVLGVMFSAVLFLPTISALKNSNRGGLNFDLIKDFHFFGQPSSVIQNYTYGSVSSLGSVALFCGTFAIIGCISALIAKQISKAEKIMNICMFGFLFVLFFWIPMYAAFSLLKEVGSYWYRYSHLGIFIIIYLAACYYMSVDRDSEYLCTIKSGLILTIAIIACDTLHASQDVKKTYCTLAVIIILSVLIFLVFYVIKNKRNKREIIILSSLVFVISMGDVIYNMKLLMDNYHVSDVEVYQNYVKNQEMQIEQLKNYDNDIYRISQTLTRNESPDVGITAYYNEALAYNYWSISGYTSSPDDIQRSFLNNMGYRICGENMCVVNTSILGTDSLLGVKYVLSEMPINGLEIKEDLGTYNSKSVYENPYCLPFAFTCNGNFEGQEISSNPFENQNMLYGKLLGETVEIYKPIKSVIRQNGDIEQGLPCIIDLEFEQGDYAIYGNIPWYSEMNSVINLNGRKKISYSQWLSPSVFYVPTDKQDTTAYLEMTSANSYNFSESNMQFYALDLNELKRVTTLLSQNKAEITDMKNGHVVIKTEADTKQQALYIAVPYDKGWSIKCNGKEVSYQLAGDCMYIIPLDKGENVINMDYHVPMQKQGVVLSLISIVGIVLVEILERKKWQNGGR